jgi:cell division septation protein DedD
MRLITLPNVLLACVLALPLLPGCNDANKTVSLEPALKDYNAKRYAAAQARAEQVSKSATGALQDDAAYLAGLSAYQAGDMAAAERHLADAAGAQDKQTAARASAMLGLVRMKQGRYREAGDLLTSASKNLTGDEAKKASQQAAAAYASASSGGGASSASKTAQAARSDSAGNARSASSPSRFATASSQASGFALQVGAFHDRGRADKAAKAARPLAIRHNLAPPRVITTRGNDGSTVYLVQFGEFATRDAAAAAKSKMQSLDCIITPLASAM